MYLKRIELEGFKSFAERTVIPVERGLTGIVGPNGCGKSNVVDALLWVLGERSAKALRADAMEDVIFKGAEGRASAPYAMVEVVLGDPEGQVAEAGGEVAVTRRLFSNGESEYLLQGRKVRRRDVREMLMDTGLGVRGYMVLAQGKIDAVLAANPAERRGVFEEASGISRYKARKREAQLKLEKVAQDLARVDDVLGEVGKAVRALRLQAGKARRWIEMRDRYRELRARIGCADVAVSSAQERALREAVRSLEERIEALRGERRSAEEQVQALELEEQVLRERHEALRAESGEVKERVAGLEERIAGLETRAAEGESRMGRDRDRLTALRARRDAETATLRELQEAVGRQQAALVAARTAAQDAEFAFAAARDARLQLRARLEELRSAMLAALDERTRRHNEVALAAKQRGEAEGHLRALERRRAEITSECASAVSAAEDLERSTGAATARLRDARAAAQERLARRDALRDERAGCAAAAHEARQKASAARARWEAMLAVEEETAAVPAHLQSLRAAKSAQGAWLLDGIEIEAPWDRLVENLLGRMQHAFWVADRETARRQEPKGGAADFLFPAAAPDPLPELAGAQTLASRIGGAPERVAALCRRLGAVYTVDDAAAAARLAELHPRVVFLSRDGEAHGAGWSRRGILLEEAAGPLARRNDRERAQRHAERSEAELARAHELETRAAAAVQAAESELAAAEEARRRAQAADDDLIAKRENARKRAEALGQEERALCAEDEALRAAAAAAHAAEAVAARARDEAEARRLTAEQELTSLQEESGRRDEAYDQRGQSAHEARAGVDRAAREQAHALEACAAHEAAAAQIGDELAAVEGEVGGLAGGLGELRAAAGAAREERDALLKRRAELSERTAAAAVQARRAAEGLSSARHRLGGESGRLEELLGERQERALELQRVEMGRAELVRGVVEEFGQSIEDLARSLAVDPAQPLPAGADEAALRAELAELRSRIESLGAVNLEAVQELEEREQRLKFLETERADLTGARAELDATLTDLDRECGERFLATFTVVQGHFEQIFRRLFRGGRAELRLEDGVNPLDAGIEISVRPPGKELRSINLLSGGERTLTALALLLAVFHSRPSPFCLLDEVDAALDDANVERFLDALQDFTGTTQFLVVTHNRITMARCSRLFGVTMRRRGVSMVVSVELDELPEEPGASFPAVAGEVDAPRGRGQPPRAAPPSERALEAGGN
jgi:chromosome segregation protein